MPSVPFISARVILDLAKGPHTPHRAAVRVLSPAQRSLLEEMIKLWLQQDIIEESASQWSFPIISVAKKRQAGQTTPQYQFCADLRVLNSKVLADSLFTGSVLANLALLEKHNIYTALDMWNAFESCQLEPSSRDFFAFSSPSGRQFRYKRLPQGFSNSPAIMSHLTLELLANLAKLSHMAPNVPDNPQPVNIKQGAGSEQGASKEQVPSDTSNNNTPLNTSKDTPQTPPKIKPMLKTPPINNSGTLGYVDDILVYSLTLEDHINILQILFHRIKEAKCCLKTNKCFIARDKMEYLAYMVGADGIGMIEEYRGSKTVWPIPTSKMELASYLGRSGYYRQFLPQYSDLTSDLN